MLTRRAHRFSRRARAGARLSIGAVRPAFAVWTRAFSENNLLTYASAIALQLLVALAALVFLAAALLHPLGATRIWAHTVIPALAAHVPVEWLRAVTWSVNREMSSDSTTLIVFGAVLALWEVSGAVRAVMGALNQIYSVSEHRGFVRRFGTSIGMALIVSVLLLVAVFIGGGAFEPGPVAVDGLERWLIPAVAIYLTIALLVQVAPAKRQPWGWVSAGSVVIVVGWLAVSAGYGWWITHVVDLHSPESALALILSVVGYLYASAITFLVGAQMDQLARKGGWRAVLGVDEE